jgi:hypothetical protein
MHLEQTCSAWWHRLTTGRYTRALEEEVERLRAENRALTNSLLGTAGIPPLDFSDDARRGLPEVPRLRRRSWQQIQALHELAQARRAQATVQAAAPRKPNGGGP